MTADYGALAGANVSRETQDRLAAFEALVRKWTPAINLVSRATVDEIAARHIADSLQLVAMAGASATKWVDLGSGGGFPGIVVAIAGPEFHAGMTVTLVESDLRKAAFLRAAVRELDLPAEVRAERIEAVPPLAADVVSARALAPLDRLLGYAQRHLAQNGIALFLKGAAVEAEIDEALEHWRFSHQKVPSKTDSAGVILKIGGIARV